MLGNFGGGLVSLRRASDLWVGYCRGYLVEYSTRCSPKKGSETTVDCPPAPPVSLHSPRSVLVYLVEVQLCMEIVHRCSRRPWCALPCLPIDH